MERRFESHLLPVRIYGVRTKDEHDDRARRVCSIGREVPQRVSLPESEWIDWSAAIPFGVNELRVQGAVLLSADARRSGHQQQSRAGQLSGLPVSRAQSSSVTGEFRALDLGTVRGE